MWIAQIARTERHGSTLDIVVHFGDDKDQEYDETYTLSDAQNDGFVQGKITTRLNQLNSLDSYQQTLDQSISKTDTFSIDPDQGVLVATPIIDQDSLGTV